MWTIIKSDYSTILVTIGNLLVAFALAYLFEDYYRILARLSFKFFNGDNIQFIGKEFRLFASDIFVVSFGLFASLTFLLLKFSDRRDRIKKNCLTIAIFFATAILIIATALGWLLNVLLVMMELED